MPWPKGEFLVSVATVNFRTFAPVGPKGRVHGLTEAEASPGARAQMEHRRGAGPLRVPGNALPPRGRERGAQHVMAGMLLQDQHVRCHAHNAVTQLSA